MSGGAFDYDCFKISQFAEELQNRIDVNDKKDDNDSLFSSAKIPKDLLKLLQESQKVIDLAGKLAHDIEWFYSGDIGEETLEKRLKVSLEEKKPEDSCNPPIVAKCLIGEISKTLTNLYEEWVIKTGNYNATHDIKKQAFIAGYKMGQGDTITTLIPKYTKKKKGVEK